MCDLCGEKKPNLYPVHVVPVLPVTDLGNTLQVCDDCHGVLTE